MAYGDSEAEQTDAVLAEARYWQQQAKEQFAETARLRAEIERRQREAARDALDNLGEKVSQAVFAKEPHPCIFVNSAQLKNVIDNAVSAMGDTTAALAERDRAIERKTAERCAAIAELYACSYLGTTEKIRDEIRREFNLEPKPEAK